MLKWVVAILVAAVIGLSVVGTMSFLHQQHKIDMQANQIALIRGDLADLRDRIGDAIPGLPEAPVLRGVTDLYIEIRSLQDRALDLEGETRVLSDTAKNIEEKITLPFDCSSGSVIVRSSVISGGLFACWTGP